VEHPYSNTARGNYIALLQAMGRTGEEIDVELASLTGWTPWRNESPWARQRSAMR